MSEWTIDELAHVTGFSARNVRNHQTRGILAGPRMVGRVGYYNEQHVARLELIRRLQDEGMSLKTIEGLLATRGDVADRMYAMRLEVLSQVSPDQRLTRLTTEEALERFGPFDTQAVTLALKLRSVEIDPEGTFIVRDPALLVVLDQAASDGLSLEGALSAAVEVQELCERASETFVNLIREEIWGPFSEAGRPDEAWEKVRSTIEKIRPLADRIFSLMLPPAINAQVERVFAEEIAKQAARAEHPSIR